MSNDPEYMNDYMKNRWKERRIKAIKKLGGKCVKCPSVENLEFDHIDPSSKIRNVAQMSSMSEEIFWLEVSKCQLLCFECHKAKTLIDLDHVNAKTTHGTLSSYRYCKCDLCKQAKADYMKNYNKTHVRKRDKV